MSSLLSIRWPGIWQIVSRCLFRINYFIFIAGVLKEVLEASIDGASIIDLCQLGDRLILEGTSKVFKKEKEMKKGTEDWCVIHF